MSHIVDGINELVILSFYWLFNWHNIDFCCSEHFIPLISNNMPIFYLSIECSSSFFIIAASNNKVTIKEVDTPLHLHVPVMVLNGNILQNSSLCLNRCMALSLAVIMLISHNIIPCVCTGAWH